MPLGRRAVLRVGMLAVIASTTTACTADRSTITSPPFGGRSPIVPGAAPSADAGGISSVAMVGDSISVAAREPLMRMFEAAELDVVTLDAESGRRMVAGAGAVASGIDVLRLIGAAGSPPDLWVVALGTNDAGQYPADQYSAVISDVLSVIPERAPVVWVDIFIEEAADVSAQFNSALDTALGARGSAVLAPWSAVAQGDGVLADGIRPSDTGTQLFANVVGEAVAVAAGR